MTLDVTWGNGQVSRFPAYWLRVMAPLVARPQNPFTEREARSSKGWLVETLKIPEVSYGDLFPETSTPEGLRA